MAAVTYRLEVTTLSGPLVCHLRSFTGAKVTAGHIGRIPGSRITSPNGRVWVLEEGARKVTKWQEQHHADPN